MTSREKYDLDTNKIINSLVYNYTNSSQLKYLPNTKSSNTYNNIFINNNINEFDQEVIDIIKKLSELGICFESKTSLETKLFIQQFDLIFPICCVGKNRSQFLFYYFYHLKKNYPNNCFNLGYPASGDELSTIINTNKTGFGLGSVLGGFSVQYKSDSFSKSIENCFGQEKSRSIHIFDKIIRTPEEYSLQDIQNLEEFKYKNTNLDLFDKDKNYILDLYCDYYLNPSNILNILASKTNIRRITYICASSESFCNLVKVFYTLHVQNRISLNHNTYVRIVYFGFEDIFQRSSVNLQALNILKQNLESTFTIIN